MVTSFTRNISIIIHMGTLAVVVNTGYYYAVIYHSHFCISFHLIFGLSYTNTYQSSQVAEDFLPIIVRVKSVMSSHGGSKGEISYAKEHEAVWFKGRRFTPNVWANTPGEQQIKQLKPAIDSKGRKVGEEWFTTIKVENALARY